MCGLAGVVRWSGRPSGEDVAAVLSMLDAQAHRGPDDWGLVLPRSLAHGGGLPVAARDPDHVRTYDDGAMGPAAILGARRLSIVDLSARGRMPMGDERGRLSAQMLRQRRPARSMRVSASWGPHVPAS